MHGAFCCFRRVSVLSARGDSPDFFFLKERPESCISEFTALDVSNTGAGQAQARNPGMQGPQLLSVRVRLGGAGLDPLHKPGMLVSQGSCSKSQATSPRPFPVCLHFPSGSC